MNHRLFASVCLVTLSLAGCGGGSSKEGSSAAGATLSSPAAYSAGLTGTLALAAAVNDPALVAGVQFQVDGMAVGSEVSAAPYRVSIDTAAYAAGQHVLRVRARDSAGVLSGWNAVTVSFGGSQSAPQGFTKNDAWVGGLNNATAFAQAPDGRWFVAQQGGLVRVVKNGALLSTPFHTLAGVDSTNERGLIGIALHPGFASNGWIYVHYTSTAGVTHNRISRLVAVGDVSNGGEDVLVDLPPLSSATNHNGGALHFAGDGTLYVGVGDNANKALPQDLTSPMGKLLRFNDDGSIPASNPFAATQSGLARAIWAYGLRNPFTFAIQPGSGRIHINDVGESTWEEIDLGAAAANYGWPTSEGPDHVSGMITGPLFTYRHSATSPPGTGPGGFFVGDVLAGGAFYPDGGNFPAAYHGSYFFSDYEAGWIGRLDGGNGWAAYAFAQLSGNPVDLRVGNDQALYALTRSGIARISYP